ncbi:hypothetical protein ACFYTQ_34600 [Nocardia sp. NPDC004068]|uniref:hypothetical protein n=1 Tax=Nocardia sp. NPDC004068 TaxID=3364303 RepID=UPI00369F7570
MNDKGAEAGLRLSCTERHVTRWENGEVRKPSADYATALIALNAPCPQDASVPRRSPSGWHSVEEPVRGGSDAVTISPAMSAQDCDRFLEAVGAAVIGSSTDKLTPWLPSLPQSSCVPARVDGDDVAFIVSTTAGLRRQDQRHGGATVVDMAAATMRASQGLLLGCKDHRTKTALAVALADLARVAGWAYHDIGDHRRARQYLTLAMLYAGTAGAPSLVASILYVLGRISLGDRRPQHALRMFQLGQVPAQDAANNAESARLHANAAWAHAMMGNERLMRESLGRAEHELGRVDDKQIDPWTRVFFTPGEFTGLQSVIYNEMAATLHDDPARSARYTSAALDLIAHSLAAPLYARPTRSVLFDHITAAACQFRLHETELAVESARTALDMSSGILSARAVDRLRSIADPAASIDHNDAREIRRRIRRLMHPQQEQQAMSAESRTPSVG